VADSPNAHFLGVFLHKFDNVASTNLAFFEDSKVKTDTTALKKHLREFRVLHLDPEPEAGNSRLRYFDQSTPNTKNVAYVNLVFWHALNREILSKLRKAEIAPTELTLPVLVVLDGVDAGRFVDSTVTFEIHLLVSFQIQCPKHDPVIHWFFENARRNCLAHIGNFFAQRHTH
jgi:hypothetical protein